MAQITVWGVVNGNGTVVEGSHGQDGQLSFSVSRTNTGTYAVTFVTAFTSIPAMVGSQWGFGSGQNTRDNVIFPFLTTNGATVCTGDANGNYTDRHFSFNAVGYVTVQP